MIKPALLASVALLSTLAGISAQEPAPFDMTPESDRVTPAVPAPTTTDTPAMPEVLAPAPTQLARYLLPTAGLRLEGEESKEGVVVYLTAAQAAAPATLTLSYLNALVVAPEVSSLRVSVNQTEIANTAISSSAAPSSIALEVPAGLLRAGANTIEFRATQRHRTDCTVESTFELWTSIAAGSAQLNLAGEGLDRISQLSELGAVGVDENGKTTLRIITSGISDPKAQAALLRLVQQIGLSVRAPSLAVTLVDAPSTEHQPGVLDIAIMPAADLPTTLEAARSQAGAAPFAAMVPSGDNNVLVLSGPNWDAVASTRDALAAAASISPERPRYDLPWPVPMLSGNSSATLASLGLDRLEFNGRRYAGNLQFELPADFYGYRYGELELILDAAYSSDVLPGSEIDIYTNGEIASATPLLRTDGGTLEDTRIRIPMTNLRPGRNVATVAVNLLTSSDAACNAGWTGSAPVRFVLSNNSTFQLPDYARALTMPNLRVLTGSGWPYAEEGSVPLALGPGNEALAAALMFATRIATAAGKTIDFDIVPESEIAPDRDAIFVMPTSGLSPLSLTRTGIGTPAAGTPSDDAVFNRFSTNQPSGPFAGPTQWLLETVGLELDDLRLTPAPDLPYAPKAEEVVVSQMHQSEGGLWTVLTASTAPALVAGTEKLTETPNWRQVAGRVSTLAPDATTLATIPAGAVSIRPTDELSLVNARRVAANWFSGNIAYFALLVILGAVVLMFTTSRLLTKIGRPS